MPSGQETLTIEAVTGCPDTAEPEPEAQTTAELRVLAVAAVRVEVSAWLLRFDDCICTAGEPV